MTQPALYYIIYTATKSRMKLSFVIYPSFAVRAPVHKTRWSVILSISKPIRLLHTLAAGLSGGFTIWCLTAAMGGQYTSLGVPCSAEGADVCLNEHHLMLVLFGVYMVCYLFMAL